MNVNRCQQVPLSTAQHVDFSLCSSFSPPEQLILNKQFKVHSLPCPWARLTSHTAVERLLTGVTTSAGLAKKSLYLLRIECLLDKNR